MTTLNRVYLQGLAARNRLTDARGEVHRLLDHLPADKHRAVSDIYNQLCSVQGALETLLEDVPTKTYSTCQILRVKRRQHGKFGPDGEITFTHTEVVIEACGTPLFEEKARSQGVCHGCRRGLEVEGNRFASEEERARAQQYRSEKTD